jgi:P27 family predicted phage terminase small subunit
LEIKHMTQITDATILKLARKKGVKGVSRPPDYLSGYAKVLFKHVLSVMPSGALRRADRSVLVVFCEAAATHRAAQESVESCGFVLTDDRGIGKANPAVVALNQAGGRMLAAARELRLTPRSREKMGLDDDIGDAGVWGDY